MSSKNSGEFMGTGRRYGKSQRKGEEEEDAERVDLFEMLSLRCVRSVKTGSSSLRLATRVP